MKRRNNTSRIFYRAWVMIATLAVLLLFCKMSGRLAWSWSGVALGYVGIMCSLMFSFVFLANAVIIACKLHHWNRTRRVVNRIRKDFKTLTYDKVLDKAVSRYNLSQKTGEIDKALYEWILKTIKEVRAT